MVRSTTAFVELLRQQNDLVEIECEVDPKFELAEIHRRVIEQGGKALLFKRVKGSPFPVATNLFGNKARIQLAFGAEPEEFVRRVAALAHELLPPTAGKLWQARDVIWKGLKVGLKNKNNGPIFQNEVALEPGKGLDLLPALTQWPQDGGRFVTLPLVYTENPTTKKHNLGMYRIQLHDHNTTGLHWQIHKGGGYHYNIAQQQNEPLPVTLFIGGPPALMLSAIAPLPEDVPELLLCSLLLGERLPRSKRSDLPHPLVCEAEFAIVGSAPPRTRRLEGPFGDHYGYYSLAHEYPIFNVQKMFHRDNAIYPATVVGKPRQEDFYIGDYLQDLLSPLFPLVMPSVIDLWSYGETGFHALAAARVKDRYEREAIASALRILGEGQLSLQKFLMVTDGPVNLRNFKETLVYFLERTNWQKDLFVISNVSQDTLDYSGPKVNEGSKGIWLALGAKSRDLSANIPSGIPVNKAAFFVPGCLVVSGPAFAAEPKFAQRLAEDPRLTGVELVILVDDVADAVSSPEKLLWHWFTRFEPAADIYASKMESVRFHTQLTAPVVFDSRMKPWYPDVVEADPETIKLVDRRWSEYGI